MGKEIIYKKLNKEERQEIKYKSIEKLTKSLCADASWKHKSAEKIFENVASNIDSFLHNQMVRKVAKINIERAASTILKKLKNLKRCHSNEYNMVEFETWGFVGVYDDFNDCPMIIVDSNEQRMRENAVVLCEIQLLEKNPKAHIINELEKGKGDFLDSNQLRMYVNMKGEVFYPVGEVIGEAFEEE